MARLNILLTGYSIADEIINRTSSASVKIGHDLIRYVAADFEIWTGASKTGTQLALTTDFTLSGEDTAYTALAGVPIYTKLAIVNGAYHSMSLYVTYKTCGDYTSVENIKEIADNTIYPLTGTVSANTTYTIPEGEKAYTVIIPKAYLVADSGGPYALTLTTGVSGKDNVIIPISRSTVTGINKSLQFNVYVDTAGNVTSESFSYSGLLDMVLTFGGSGVNVVYVRRSLRFTVTSDLNCWINLFLQISSTGGNTGLVAIEDMPFLAAAGQENNSALALRNYRILYTGIIQASISGGSQAIILEKCDEAGTVTQLTSGYFEQDAAIMLTGQYRISI